MPELKRLVIPATLAALTLLCGVTLYTGNASEQAVRATVRATAALSFALLCLAFSASALAARLPPGAWQPVLRARRRIGISFAISHTVHLATIMLLVEVAYGGDYGKLGSLAGGAVIYAIIYAMAFTSNDTAVRALGARNWKRLHTVGGYILMLVFTGQYLGTALERNDYYWLYVLIGGAVILLRLARKMATGVR